jgi:type IV pilus secretin PilQ/predicted competence protein
MMRCSGLGVVRWGVICAIGVALTGCARPAAVKEETTVSASSPIQPAGQEPLTEAALPGGPQAATAAPVDIREIKVIEDNGQQGLFVKLTGPPVGVTHYSLSQPNRLVIDVGGAATGAQTSAQKYAVDNPVISEVRVGRSEGKLRLTLVLRSDKVPTYTVNDLNDTIVAFLGEPSGGTEPVHEQIVFTRRAVETARRKRSAPPAELQPPAGVPQVLAGPSVVSEMQPVMGLPGRGQLHANQVYQGQHVSLDFKDADVHNVLRLLAEVSKLNIVATDDVHGKVTLRLFDVPWDQALDIILQVLNLESTQERNVIRISTVKRLREEREELQRAQEAAKAVEPLRVEYFKVNYAKALNLSRIISGAGLNAVRARTSGTGGSGGDGDTGLLTSRGSVFVDEFSNTIVVRDIQRGVDNARELVRRLDVQTPQVLIESRIVEATTDFARDLGVQWGYRNLQSPQTGNPTGVNFPGTVAIGGSGLGVGASGLPFIADFPAAVGPGAGSALNLALGSIDGSQSLDIRITAEESTGKARIISRPRVVTLNNVAATIKSLTVIRVKLPGTGTVINTGAGGAAGGGSTATERIETGIILVVTPQVSADGFVMLDMFAKSSQADFARQVDGIPTEISREANSHILVKDGQTVVLGGIYRENASDNQTGIPFLKDLPAFGWLFRKIDKRNSREDLLVFLTPHTINGVSPTLPTAAELWKNRDAGREDAAGREG